MKSDRRAFTAVELIVAISITAMIALSAAGVSMVLSRAYADSRQSYSSLQTARSVIMRIRREISQAKLITSVTPGTVVYWQADLNGDGQINISELAVIEFDSEQQLLLAHKVVFPDSMDADTQAAFDVKVPLQNAVNSTVENLIRNNIRSVSRILGTGITSFTATATPDCPRAQLLSVRIATGHGISAVIMQTAVAVRASRIWDIAMADGQYVLLGTNSNGDQGD